MKNEMINSFNDIHLIHYFCNNPNFQKLTFKYENAKNWSQVVQYMYLTQKRVKTPLQLRINESSNGPDDLT